VRLPRDLSGDDLVQLLRRRGYAVVRQTGSHLRLTTESGGTHHVTIPRHDPLRLGTLSGILADVALHFGVSKEELVRDLLE
jgi:predicted RNA binding protein YcfA (HicA-like mRNA interferase family)